MLLAAGDIVLVQVRLATSQEHSYEMLLYNLELASAPLAQSSSSSIAATSMVAAGMQGEEQGTATIAQALLGLQRLVLDKFSLLERQLAVQQQTILELQTQLLCMKDHSRSECETATKPEERSE